MKLASIASNRLEVLIGRIAGSALIINGIEPFFNGLAQLERLNDLGTAFLLIFVASSMVSGIGGWTTFARRLFSAHALVVLVLMLLSPFGYIAPLDAVERPWVWWALGLAAVVFGVSQQNQLRWMFIVLLGVGWFVVFGFGFGEPQTQIAILDSLYVIVFAIAVVSLTELVRQGANDVDLANTEAIESALEQARTDAVERERARIDALMHDQVMHTLLLAARADSKEEQLRAARSAEAALASLTSVGMEKPSEVSSLGLLQAIQKAALKLDSRISVNLSGGDSVAIPAEVAEAITEATLQAVDNAIQHSRANQIQINLLARKGLLEFSIVDDGVGFRFERISRYRIGIKTSILARMKTIGGEAKVVSAPQEGTRVELRWSNA